jgi:hypothetical protein
MCAEAPFACGPCDMAPADPALDQFVKLRRRVEFVVIDLRKHAPNVGALCANRFFDLLRYSAAVRIARTAWS